MASSAIGFIDINGIVHRLSDVSATSQPTGTQSSTATVDSGNVQTPCAKVVLDAALAAQALAPDAGDRVDVVTISSANPDYALPARVRVVLCNTAAACSVQLPSPATFTGLVTFKDIVDASAFNITIKRAASESINGSAANYVISTLGASVTLCSNGTNWFLV